MNPNFEVIAIPAFRDNYIWLLRRGRHAVVVDPGDAAPVEALIEAEGLTLDAILITHHHADHQGGVERLVERWQPTVYGPAAESITALSSPLGGGEVIVLDGLDTSFMVMAVPGHTRGHLAYVGDGCLFCGDTLFGAGCGRLFEGTPAQMAASLDQLSGLPDMTQVFCAHEYTAQNLKFARAVEPGNLMLQLREKEVTALRERGESTVPSTIAMEKATNPFLRCDVGEVVAAARQRDPAASDPVSVFAALRAWRNEF